MAVVEMAIKKEMAAASLPSEGHAHFSADPLGLEERILTLCSQNPKGITDKLIVEDQPNIDAEKRMRALQRLLSQVMVEL